MALLPGTGSILAGVQLKQTFKQSIVGAGLSTGFAMCLDAADLLSCTGGQTITDVSGASYNFTNGMTSSVESNDMVFTGLAGSLTKNTYFLNNDVSSGEGDQQGIKAASQPTWVANGHTSTANFTVAGWFYLPTTANDTAAFFTTFQIYWQSSTGFALGMQSGGLYFYTGGSAHGAGADFGGVSISRNDAWHFVAAGVKSGSTSWVQVDGTQTTAAYTSSQTGTATSNMTIGMNANKRWSTGLNSRLAGAFGWSRQLSTTEGLALYNATRTRFV
jgi:hypothetical protein